MKTTFTRRQRFHHRAAARRHYVDPLLFREGWFTSRQDAAEHTTRAVIHLRLPTDAAGNLALGLDKGAASYPRE